MTLEELTLWRKKWDSFPNTFTDIDGPFTSLALASDVMITDGVSFIAEYPLVTRKSVIFWEKPDHWEFSPLGKIAADTTHTVSSMGQVVSGLELAKAGKLAPKEQEINALIKAVRPGKTSAATAIVSLVLDDYASDKGD
jgi:hypothetical protein